MTLPSPDLFMRGIVPEELTEPDRQWLADQLAQWPKRVDESRTCAIGALTDMATAEFCRLQSDPFRLALETLMDADDKRQRENRNPETPREKAAHVVICYLAHVRDGRL